MRRRLFVGAAAAAALPLHSIAIAAPAQLRGSRSMMGTRVDIAVRGAGAGALQAALTAAFERMQRLAAMMSHYSPTSRVAAINLAAGLVPVEIPVELVTVLRMARDVSMRTSGAFDVTVGAFGRWPDLRAPGEPGRRSHVDFRDLVLDERRGTASLRHRGMRVDPGGIAKLYILQEGLRALQAHGVATALVNGGGDVLAASARGQPPWRVAIRDPRQPGRLLAALDVRQGFVASSGNYERFFVRDGRRYHHIVDPRSGRPTEGTSGVTLVARELEGVNGLGAALMVLGAGAGRGVLARTRGTEALIASAGGELWLSAGLRDQLVSPS